MAKTIAYKNIPSKPPILLTAVAWLMLDRFDASAFVWGVTITLLALVWINQIAGMVREDTVDLFATDKGTKE